jgi:hypothetical protein
MITKLVEKRDTCMRQAVPSRETLRADIIFGDRKGLKKI